jgi:hypothetical protein
MYAMGRALQKSEANFDRDQPHLEALLEDYLDAALRHYKDAETLRSLGDLDNAGHLIGFAAECAIKYRISTIITANNPRVHFPDIAQAAKKHFGHRGGYHPLFDVLKRDLMVGWAIDRRYFSTGNTTAVELDSWFQDTKRIFASVSIKRRA